MKIKLSDNLSDCVREVHCRVGRNLLLFQKIEFRLKIVAPHLKFDGNETKLIIPESIENLLAQPKSFKMLGKVVKDLKLSFPYESITGFHDYLNFVLNERNMFVHDLEDHPEFGVLSINQCKSSILYLDRQHQSCLPMLLIATQLSQAAFAGISDLN